MLRTLGGSSGEQPVCICVADNGDRCIPFDCSVTLPYHVVKYSHYNLPQRSYGHASGQDPAGGEGPAGGSPGPTPALNLSSFCIAFPILFHLEKEFSG